MSLNNIFTYAENNQEKIIEKSNSATRKTSSLRSTSSEKRLPVIDRSKSKSRLELYTQRLETTNSSTKDLAKNYESMRKISNTKDNRISMISMNCFPIFEGLWTKKIENNYKRKL